MVAGAAMAAARGDRPAPPVPPGAPHRSFTAGPRSRVHALEAATWGGFAAAAVVGGLWVPPR